MHPVALAEALALAYQVCPKKAFIECSPELLYVRVDYACRLMQMGYNAEQIRGITNWKKTALRSATNNVVLQVVCPKDKAREVKEAIRGKLKTNKKKANSQTKTNKQ